MESLRRKAKEASSFNFVFSGRYQHVIQRFNEQKEAFRHQVPCPYGAWFGHHLQEPYLELGNIVPPERRPEIPAGPKFSFSNIVENTTYLGYGFIAKHEHNMELARLAQRTTMKTVSFPRTGNHLYQVFIKQPTSGQKYRPGQTGFISFRNPLPEDELDDAGSARNNPGVPLDKLGCRRSRHLGSRY